MTRLGRPVHGRAVRDYLLVDTRTLGPAAMSDNTVRITRNASFSAFSPSPSISDRTLATFLMVYCSDTGRVQLMVALSIEGRLGQVVTICHLEIPTPGEMALSSLQVREAVRPLGGVLSVALAGLLSHLKTNCSSWAAPN